MLVLTNVFPIFIIGPHSFQIFFKKKDASFFFFDFSYYHPFELPNFWKKAAC